MAMCAINTAIIVQLKVVQQHN